MDKGRIKESGTDEAASGDQVDSTIREKEEIRDKIAEELFQFEYVMNDDNDPKNYVPWDRRHAIATMSEDERMALPDGEYDRYKIYTNSRVRRNNLSSAASSVDNAIDVVLAEADLGYRATIQDLETRSSLIINSLDRDDKIFDVVKWYVTVDSDAKNQIVQKIREKYGDISEMIQGDEDFLREIAIFFMPEVAKIMPGEMQAFMVEKAEELTKGRAYIDTTKYVPEVKKLAYDTLRAMYPEYDLLKDEAFENELRKKFD